jgi:hypothetical protein
VDDVDDTVDVNVEEIVKETERSFLVLTHDGLEIWLPKSQLDNAGQLSVGDTDPTLVLPRWLASKHDLI